MPRRALRENAREGKPLGSEWSPWHKFIVPGDVRSARDRRKTYKGPWMPREGGVGWRLKFHNLCHLVPASQCGVYELKVESASRSLVVYVGSTCQCHRGRLVRRIFEYSKNGSHKERLIDGALKNGFSISFRFRKAGSKTTAQKEENELLDSFDYAWNVRNNGSIRHIV